MTKWRKLSGEKQVSATAATSRIISKSKMHPKYRKFFSENTVMTLRIQARSAGEKKWYSLRKGPLASALVIHHSAMMVTNMFREIVNKKRQETLRSHEKNGSSCPISLTPILDLEKHDVFIHGRVVFSRTAILDYVKASADFLNPITRTMMHLHDIKRLRCQHALVKYNNRKYLRIVEVNSIRQFSFLETEIENILMGLVHHFYCQDTLFFEDSYVAFKETWKHMKVVDRTRTVCVLKSLENSMDRFRGKPRLWGRSLVAKYLRKTEELKN